MLAKQRILISFGKISGICSRESLRKVLRGFVKKLLFPSFVVIRKFTCSSFLFF